MVSEIFVESVQEAAVSFGMSQAFVGFIVVALVGGAAEMASAFSGACRNHLEANEVCVIPKGIPHEIICASPRNRRAVLTPPRFDGEDEQISGVLREIARQL